VGKIACRDSSAKAQSVRDLPTVLGPQVGKIAQPPYETATMQQAHPTLRS